MIDKFNGIFYLIIFLIHFIGVGAYAYQMIIGNQKFRAKVSNRCLCSYHHENGWSNIF